MNDMSLPNCFSVAEVTCRTSWGNSLIEEGGKLGGGALKSASVNGFSLIFLSGLNKYPTVAGLMMQWCIDLMPRRRANGGNQWVKSWNTKWGLRSRRKDSVEGAVRSIAVMIRECNGKGTSEVVSEPGGRPSTCGTVIGMKEMRFLCRLKGSSLAWVLVGNKKYSVASLSKLVREVEEGG